MNPTAELVLKTLGTIIACALICVGLFLALKRSLEPRKVILKALSSALLVGGEGFLIHYESTHLVEGLSFANFGIAVIMTLSVVVCGVILSILWTPHLNEVFISPLAGLFDGGHEPPEQKPFYSIAIAKRNRGRPREAVEEICRQLGRFPNDFEGVMLLARIQAEDLSDLPAAELTLNEFCDWPAAPEKHIAAAWTQLADWQLKLGNDAGAARAALQKIVARFPDTETALHAEQRIAHLAGAEKMILARQEPKNVELQAGIENIGLLDSSSSLNPSEIPPGKIAAAYVKHLEAHPHDNEVREKLATIYARDFKRLDLATMELAQLINEPRHKPRQIAQWLNLLANFQVELGADIATVRATLGKIVESFPTLPVAELAQRRIARLENEFKGIRQSASVRLGSYEQSIGLKYGKPGKK